MTHPVATLAFAVGLVFLAWMSPSSAAPTPVAPLPPPTTVGAAPARWFPGGFVSEPSWQRRIADYVERWAATQHRHRPQAARANGGLYDSELAQQLWTALIAPGASDGTPWERNQTDARRQLLALPTRPGWRAVAFSPWILPCLYRNEGAEFGIHYDAPHHCDGGGPASACYEPDYVRGTTGPVNWAKLVLYAASAEVRGNGFLGGEFAIYDRDPHAVPRRNSRDPRPPPPGEIQRFEPQAGDAILFDLWFPHASLPLRCDPATGTTAVQCTHKVALGLRVMYTRESPP